MSASLRCVVCAVIVVLGGLLPGGCVATGEAVAWIRGTLQTNLDAPIDRAAAAASQAIHELKFTLDTSKVDALTGEITARTAQDDDVEINLRKVTDKTTAIGIRVGFMGDRLMSQQILDEIKKRL